MYLTLTLSITALSTHCLVSESSEFYSDLHTDAFFIYFQNYICWKKDWVLQLKTQSQVNKRTLYRVYTRELNRVPDTKCLSYIYLANNLCYTKPSLL